MIYRFNFYHEKDFEEIEELVFAAYEWEYPIWGLSRHEFSRGLHPAFTGIPSVWERTVGVWRMDGKITACAINEGNDEGDIFFLFDGKERAQEEALLEEMLYFAKTTMSSVRDDRITSYVNLRIPEWNETLQAVAEKAGFHKTDWKERINILPFQDKKFEVRLPEGYSFADGETTPDFYLSNVHMAAFRYGISAVKEGERAFHDLRQMKHYDPKLDLCILDPAKRPVAMAIIWYDEKMPYCELEPLGVAWWERRKHLATAILHEASNRVMERYPKCTGMLGGDQPFYEKTGYVTKTEVPVFAWEEKI